MNKSITLLVVILGLSLAVDAVAANYYFVNNSSYAITVMPDGNGTPVTIPSKKASMQAIGASTFYYISSTPTKAVLSFASGQAKYGKGSQAGAFTSTPQMVSLSGLDTRNPNVFVIDVGVMSPTGGISVKPMKKYDALQAFPTSGLR